MKIEDVTYSVFDANGILFSEYPVNMLENARTTAEEKKGFVIMNKVEYSSRVVYSASEEVDAS